MSTPPSAMQNPKPRYIAGENIAPNDGTIKEYVVLVQSDGPMDQNALMLAYINDVLDRNGLHASAETRQKILDSLPRDKDGNLDFSRPDEGTNAPRHSTRNGPTDDKGQPIGTITGYSALMDQTFQKGIIDHAIALEPGISRSKPSEDRPHSLRIEFNTFIPQKSIDGPLGTGTFSGDNRSIGEAGTHRTQHAISVTDDPSRTPPYRVTISRDIGETHKLDANGNVIKSATASVTDLDPGQWKVGADGSIVIDLKGNGKNPLVWGAPGITYDMQLVLKPQSDGTWSIKAKGSHDEFPGYEIKASVDGGKPAIVHGYDPREHNKGPGNLMQGTLLWPSQVKVDTTSTVGQGGIVASVDKDNYQIAPNRYGVLHAQANTALGELGLSSSEKTLLAPQFALAAANEQLRSIDKIYETKSDTLSAVSINAGNHLDMQRVTLDKANALAQSPESILGQVASSKEHLHAQQADAPAKEVDPASRTVGARV